MTSMYRACLLAAVCSMASSYGYKKPFEWPQSIYQETKNNVTITANVLSKEETKQLFDGYGKQFIKKRNPIFPLRIQITNRGNGTVSLKQSDIEVPLVHVVYQENNNKMRVLGKTAFFSTTGALLGITLAPSLCIATLLGMTPFGIFIIPSILTGSNFIYFMGGTALVCGTIGGTLGYLYHEPVDPLKVDENSPSSFFQEMVIRPGQTKECLVFAPAKTFNQEFTISLTDESTQSSVPFTVSL